VTWPTRRETVITAIMVFLFVVASSLFFLVVDLFLKQGVGLIIGLGH
jgi:preprotein translocase subunit SecE